MIKATNIHKHFGTLEVLKGVDFEVRQGEIVSIIGPSGAGKTTLLQILGTLDRPDSGQVRIDNIDTMRLNEQQLAHLRNKKIGFVFQFHQLLPEFTAIENVMMPALIGGRSYGKAHHRAHELLQLLQLEHRENHKPDQLSGGEKQRVALARALINRPSVILADEPSGSLDSANKAELHRILLNLRRQFNQTIIIVTHDADLAAISDRVIRMADGRILDDAS